MTPETQTHYDTYFTLFATEGWKQFVTFAEESKERINKNEEIRDEKHLYRTQGQLIVLDHVINFQTMNENAYQAILDDEKDDSEEDEDYNV